MMNFFLQIPHICIILSEQLDILTFLMIKVANIYFHDLTRLINFHLGRLTKNMFLTKKSKFGASKHYFEAIHCLSYVEWEIAIHLCIIMS